ncbi:hypothetical protein VTJ04DRAFT_6073 [Mycothermus thermophilus]|uniref:uncharacterized protein n=1 Tax=Humicola insolens TaxID=85995 RepID=UPI0037442B0F
MASRLGLSRDPNGHDRVWKNSQELAEDAASLLDLVTACFAQYLSQVTEGGFRWRDDQLAVLAKFTAKAKYLLQNVSDNASIAVRNAEISLATFEATYGPPVDDKNEFENCDNNDERERIEIERRFKNSLNNHKFSASESGTLETIYYRLLQQLVRKHLMDSIKSVLGSLLPAIRGPGFGLTEYEVCGVVTDSAGIHGFNMFIFQDRDFEYTSTSNPDQINFAHPAFRMLDVLVAHLAQAHKMRPPSGSPQAIGSSATKTILEWEYTALDMPMEPRLESGRTLTTPASTPTVKRYYLEATKTNRVRLELRDMREIITAMVQLGIVNPGVAG